VLRQLLLALVLLFALVETSAAQSADGVRMTMRPGLDGVVKLGSWFPVEVNVANAGEGLTGEIQVQVDGVDNRGAFNRPHMLYTAPAVLPRQSNKRFVLEIFLPNPVEKLTARLVAGEKTLATTEAPIERLGQGEMRCGVLSGNRAMLDFLPGVEMPGRQRRIRIAHLELADMPAAPQLLSSLDCLVVSNVSLASLADAQRDALYSWTAAGGLLVVAGGPGWQKTLAGMPRDLLPVEVSGTVPVRHAPSLAAFFNEPIEDPGPWLVAEAKPTDGVVVVGESELPLLVAARRGQGVVFFLAFDPSLEPLRSWRGSAQLWRYLVGYAPAQVQVPSNAVRPYTSWGRHPRTAASDLSLLRPPTSDSLPWILLAYALAVGPISYFALRCAGRLEWSLWLAPLLTVGAVAAAFGAARSSSESDVLFNKITIVRSWDSGADAYSRSWVAAFSPREGSYDIEFQGKDGGTEGLVQALFHPFPASSGTPTPGAGAVKTQREDATVIKGYHLGPRSLGTFVVDARVPGEGAVRSHLKLGAGGISGTIVNGTGGKVTNAALVVGQEVVRLGDLAAGETRQIVMPLQEGSPIGYIDLPAAVRQLYPNPGVATPVSSAEAISRDILDSAFNSSFAFGQRVEFGAVALVGWMDRPPFTLQARNARAAELDRTLLVATLSLEPVSGEEVRVPFSLIERRSLVSGTGRISQNALVVSGGETLVFEYGLPARPDRFSIGDLALDVSGTVPGNASIGDVTQAAIYDWPAAEWRELPLGVGLNKLGDPSRVVSALGGLRLRLHYKQNGQGSSTALTLDRFGLAVHGRGV